jgi:two-component system, LytTR family, sensor kinase
MTISLKKYIASSRAQLNLNIVAPLFLILTLIALVNSLQVFSPLHTGAASPFMFFRILVSKLVYTWYFTFLAMVVQWHSKRIPLTRKNVVRWAFIHLATLVISFFIHETLSVGADTLIWGAKSNATIFYLFFNNPSVWIEILVYILFLLSFSLMEYRKMSQENEIRCSQLEVLLIRSKLQEIRNKIQPTFLFNTLQTILSLIHTHRNKDANHILSLLSDFLRTTVYDTDRDEIPLEEEIRFLNQYLEIEKVRSNHTFTIHEEIDQHVSNVVVPNFILQPIVEELFYRNGGRDTLQHEMIITARKAGEQLEMIIEDRGRVAAEYSLGQTNKGIVLDITKERLAHLYGDRQSLTVHESPERGALVKIRIPLREMIAESEEVIVVEQSV